jgi:hypothetical protein
MAFSWKCPFCGHHSVIEWEKQAETFKSSFNFNNKYNEQIILTKVIACPNPDCREYSISVSLHNAKWNKQSGWVTENAKHIWQLIPESIAKPFPGYIPEPLIRDYNEACLIMTKSPKASATLSRRCLQGMIRDFWGITGKRNLYEEIDAINDKVDATTFDAIDCLRQMGNIGAHMEKDINLIVDVDPNEAKLLIELIETLFKEWYVRKHEREVNMNKIKVATTQKKEDKTNPESSE